MPIDFERGAKTTGSKFYFNSGDSAKFELGLINQMVQHWLNKGYKLVFPPYLVNKETAKQAGILPRFEGDFYETTDGMLLVPTAETPLVGMHADEIIDEDKLPIRYVAVSPCFRREAGSYGKRDQGLRRVHQFHKVELFVICRPQDSVNLHDHMISQVCDLMEIFKEQGLEDYTVRRLDKDERSPISEVTYDVEVKLGKEWLEVSSISNTKENQSKPAKIRYRPKGGGKPVRCHLLNGSGVALPRLMLALKGGNV